MDWQPTSPLEVTLPRTYTKLQPPPVKDPDEHVWARLFRLVPRHKMQHKEALAEFDPVRNVVYVNEGEYDALKTDEARHAVVRHAEDMPVRTL